MCFSVYIDITERWNSHKFIVSHCSHSEWWPCNCSSFILESICHSLNNAVYTSKATSVVTNNFRLASAHILELIFRCLAPPVLKSALKFFTGRRKDTHCADLHINLSFCRCFWNSYLLLDSFTINISRCSDFKSSKHNVLDNAFINKTDKGVVWTGCLFEI